MVVARLSLLLGLLYAGYAAVMYGHQRSLLFPIAQDARHAFAGKLPDQAELIELPVSYGHARAVLLRGAMKHAPAVVFTHGNAETVDELVGSFEPIRALGVHVMLLEYPGYAGADGAPSRGSIDEASAAAFDWLARRPEVDAQRIVAMGVSLGGAPAAQLTQLRPVRALVLLSTFTAVADFAADYGLPGFLARDDYDSAQRLREFGGAVFLAHGRADSIIPFTQGETLVRASRNGELHAFDCGHNDCPYRDAAFAQMLGRFLAAHGVLDGSVPAPASARADTEAKTAR
jgi:pimeloyl-ACP methyl ester carboxylesterase